MNSESFDYFARIKLEGTENWRGINERIPAISFPAGLKVKIIAPCSGAVARFVVYLESDTECKKGVSVYLDWYSQLGCMDKPYYEMYPNLDGDCSRYFLDQTTELMTEIVEVLENQNS